MRQDQIVRPTASSRPPSADLTPRHVAYLVCSFVLAVLGVQTSDVATIRQRELNGDSRFEYPVLARALYLGERAIAPSRYGIAAANAALGIAAALTTAQLLRRHGGKTSLWIASPTLILVGVNLDAVTALLILLAIQAWKRGSPGTSGGWIGAGTAFKVAPFMLLFPALGTSTRRSAVIGLSGAAAVWLLADLPFALASPRDWAFPYLFASQRHDGAGTIWAALHLGPDATNTASTLSTLVLGLLIAIAVRSRRISFEGGAALSILGLLAFAKLWQPHYLLWALPALAVAGAPTRPVRAMEVANLACFFVLWRQLPPERAVYWIWPVYALRWLALVWTVASLIRQEWKCQGAAVPLSSVATDAPVSNDESRV